MDPSATNIQQVAKDASMFICITQQHKQFYQFYPLLHLYHMPLGM